MTKSTVCILALFFSSLTRPYEVCSSKYWGSIHKVHEEWLTSHARPQCASGMWRMFSGQCDGTKHLWWMVCHQHKLRATKNMAHLKVVVGQGEVDLRMCETFAMIQNVSKMFQNASWEFARVIHLQKKSEKNGHHDSAAGPICIHSSNHIRDKWHIDHLAGIQMGCFQLNQAQLFDMKCGCYRSFCLACLSSHFCWHNNSVSKDPKFSTRSKLGSPVRQLSIFNILGSRSGSPLQLSVKKKTQQHGQLMNLSIQLASWRFLQKWHG